jgi:tetratricopeptide (TPR) repeat protein
MNRNNLSTFAVAVLLLLGSPAFAAAPAANANANGNGNAVDKARASFHQGVLLYNEGSFEAALAEFRKAYQLNPNYRLLYNIAQTYFDLHDYVSASKALTQYAQQGGAEISAERRAQVRELNTKLEERIAYLEITCNADGAEIRVDELPVGVSPLGAPVPVNAGPRRITAVKPGYAVAARMVTVGGTERVKVALDVTGRATGAADGVAGAALTGQARHQPARVGLITSSVVVGGCAIATTVFAILAANAKTSFEQELDTYPTTRGNVDRARDKMNTYAYLTDGFGAATLLSGGVALYFLLSDGGSKKPSSARPSVALSPAPGGMLLHGRW